MVLAVLAVAWALAACARGPSLHDGGAADPVAADTLRGIVAVVGSDPATTVALRDDQYRMTMLEGAESSLRALEGLEVVVRGSAGERRTFRVSALAVRAFMGIPAVDGILVRRGTGWALALASGDAVPITDVPPDLIDRAGVRIWWAGPLDRPPGSYGIIP